MKIVFNSREPDAACTIFYRDALSRLPDVTVNDFDNYSDYDIAFFMTYPEDLNELKRVKLNYPHLKTAIIDPRNEAVMAYTEYADFLIVDSIEMRDYWTRTKLPIFEYVEFPDLKIKKKNHKKKDKIVIGYHGNVIHLNCMADTVSPALDRLSKKYNIEFHAVYNIKKQGRWEFGLPTDLKIKHIQWHKNVYSNEMSRIDIGIVPGFMPTKDHVQYGHKAKKKWFTKKNNNPVSFNYAKDDYLIRFKMPSNPGRIIVFGLLGIPVVSDFFPSAMSIIDDSENGLLAASEGGWYYALAKLLDSPEIRQKYSDNMQDKLRAKYDFNIQNKKIKQFLFTEILG